MSVLYASPLAAAAGVPTPPAGLSMSWTGWDGSVWDLTDPAISGLLLGPQVEGLGAPPVQRFTSESPAVAGSRFRGHRVSEREVFWPLHVLADPGAAWVERDAAFWRTMRPDSPGSWSVTGPAGATRSLVCRFVEVDEAWSADPALRGWASYGVHLVADDDPFWSGTPLVRSFSPGTPVAFVDAGGSPPFHISPGNLLASASVDNPGDVDAYPIWRIDGGPVTDVTIGVNGRVVEVPITVPDGASVTVDSRPHAQSATRSDGTDATTGLGEVDFAPVPPGTVVPLTLSMTGTGTVTITLVPRYLRAW